MIRFGACQHANGARRARSLSAPTPPAHDTADALVFDLLVCMADYHIHAVFDAADPYPIAACGTGIVPGIWLPGPILLCRGCLADVHEDAELHPASHVRRRVLDADPARYRGRLLALCRRYLAWRYDREIRRAVAAEWHR